MTAEHTDVVVIGSGAGGSPMALRLSEAGFRVAVLERGVDHGRSAYHHDELALSTRHDLFVPSVDTDPHVLVDHRLSDPVPQLTTLGWIASCVGGGTAHMGGSLYRFHPDDFRLRSRFGSFEGVADWPYTYADLEPYYGTAEWELGVSGDGRANPHGGPRSRPYPMPPLDTDPLAASFDRACRALSLHPFPTPKAINSRPYGGRPSCAYCHACAGFGCPTGARGSTQEALLPRAERTGRCVVRPNCTVHYIEIDSSGRAAGCLYVDGAGRERRITADVVCISCSAVESARLLLLSKSSMFPDGLANGNGLVGRNLQFHTATCGRASVPREPRASAASPGRPRLLRSIMDDYFLPPGVSPWPKGGIQRFEFDPMLPVTTAQRLALRTSGQVIWGERLKSVLRDAFHHMRELTFETFQDFVPNEHTYVELDPTVRDRLALPVARIHLDDSVHHALSGRFLFERGREILERLGADRVTANGVGVLNPAMTQGTCRAGRHASTSVLNEFCQSHEVANLFVVDGSFMPTSGGAPTTLTIAANSFRVADFVISNARSGALARHPRRLVGIGGPPGEACAAENIGVTAQQPAGGRE